MDRQVKIVIGILGSVVTLMAYRIKGINKHLNEVASLLDIIDKVQDNMILIQENEDKIKDLEFQMEVDKKFDEIVEEFDV